jgi:hypothetical protein
MVKLPNSNDTTTPILPHEMAAIATNPIPAIRFDMVPLTQYVVDLLQSNIPVFRMQRPHNSAHC